MADAGDLKSFDRKIMPVQVRQGPPRRLVQPELGKRKRFAQYFGLRLTWRADLHTLPSQGASSYTSPMNSKLRSLGIAAVFLAGCAVGGASSRFVVPAASAQQAATLTKWEFYCVAVDNDDATATANKMGAQGWDIAASGTHVSVAQNLWCFKRPKL